MYRNYIPSCGSLLKVLIEQADTKLKYIIDKYDSDKWAKKLSTRNQLEIMVSANLCQSKSLSDISNMIEGTRRFSCLKVNKSSLSRINEKRNCDIFEKLYQNLLREVRKRINYSNLRIIDSSTEIVSKILFSLWPWDNQRGAVKLTVSHDPNYELPDEIIISDGKVGDTTSVKKLNIQKTITYLFDGGFRDYEFYQKIIEKKAFFIGRQHRTTSCIFVKDLPTEEDDVISDQIVYLGLDKRRRMKNTTRLIKFWDNNHEEMWLSTNRFDLITQEVRELYKRRWEIEVFFKFLKQNLKLKKFFGTGRNAIKIQIYCALIAYLLAYLLKPKFAKMTEFLRKIRYALFLNYYQLSFFDDS